MQLLREAFERHDPQFDVTAEDLPDLFEQMLTHAVARGLVPEASRQVMLDELVSREQAHHTAIGDGVAVPHVYLDALERPAILFFRLKRPVHMGALDGEGTRYVFMLFGPTQDAVSHLDSLAAIARVMSDEGFRYAVERASSGSDLVEAFDEFVTLEHQPNLPHPEADHPLEFTGRLGGGIARDLRRRLPHYWSDFTDGFHPKTISAVGFMLFACLAPAVTFGGVMAQETGGAIGATEMLAATAICGLIYALTSGQPLIILGGTGPLLVFTAIVYQQCQSFDLPFLPVYTWVGLWSALLLVIAAVLDTSALMRWFTRFTDEVFAALISVIFILQSLTALRVAFTDGHTPSDSALLMLVVAIGTFYLGFTLGRFRSSRYLSSRAREFLADFGPTLAMALMTLIALRLDDVTLPTLAAPDNFGTTSGRPWLVDLGAVPWSVRLGAILPAFLVTLLVYLDQNITARIVNAPDHALHKGEGYHVDLLVVALLIGLCSVFGLPWLVAATVRSLNHLHSLATERGERIVHVRETRVSALAIHVLIAFALLAMPLLKLIPMAVLYGLFLMMGVNSLHGNQFFERAQLWLTDAAHYPAHHYIGRVQMAKIRLFTAIQVLCLGVLWFVKTSPLGIIFPIFIALLVPVRLWIGRFFSEADLAELDADHSPR